MITFWVNEFKHFYGLRPNDSFRFEYKHGCPSYFHELFLLYGIEFEVKTIRQDTPDPNVCNICLIPAQGMPTKNYHLGQITGAAIEAKEDIFWCYDNNIKVVIDRSREQAPYQIYDMIEYLDKEGLIDYSFFRILVMHKGPKDYYPIPAKEFYDSLIIDSEFYLYEMGGMSHNFIKSDKLDKLNISGSKYSETAKKYSFASMFGEMRKPQRLVIAQTLYKKAMLDNAFWTSLKRYSDELIKANFQTEINKFIAKYGQSIYDYLTIERQFDSGTLNNASDRIIPEQCYQSYFYLGVESSFKWNLYSEKSYKPIALGMPFVIFGNPMFNDSFFTEHGYEKYDELFDYDLFEVDTDVFGKETFTQLQNHSDKFVHGIEKALDQSLYTKELNDKCQHNRELLLNSTTKDKFMIFIEEVFDSW